MPLGFFQNILLSTDKEHKNQVDLKGIQNLFVDFLRLMALHHGLKDTNSMDRLELLRHRKIIRSELCHDIQHAYENILNLRLITQSHAIKLGEEGGNHIRPDRLGGCNHIVYSAQNKTAVFVFVLPRHHHSVSGG